MREDICIVSLSNMGPIKVKKSVRKDALCAFFNRNSVYEDQSNSDMNFQNNVILILCLREGTVSKSAGYVVPLQSDTSPQNSVYYISCSS